MTWEDLTLTKRRNSRQIKGGLGYVITWIFLNFDGKLGDLFPGGMGANKHAVTTGFSDGLDHQLP
jgi:hypothetical protein